MQEARETVIEPITEQLNEFAIDFTKLGNKILHVTDTNDMYHIIKDIFALFGKGLDIMTGLNRNMNIIAEATKSNSDKQLAGLAETLKQLNTIRSDVINKPVINNEKPINVLDSKHIRTLMKEMKKKDKGCTRCKVDTHCTEECFRFRLRTPKYIIIESSEIILESIKSWLKENNIRHMYTREGILESMYLKEIFKTNAITIFTDSLGEFNKIIELAGKRNIKLIKPKYPKEQWSKIQKDLLKVKPYLEYSWFIKRFWIDEKDNVIPLNVNTMALFTPESTKLWSELKEEYKQKLKSN